jgi:hypothetical protein
MFGLTLVAPGLSAKAAAPLTPKDMALIGVVSELIIPTTDTGGAIAAGVPDFVKLMLADWFIEAERDHFLSSMAEFSAAARKRYGKDFEELPANQKEEFFGERLAAGEVAPRAPFAVLMKRLTVFGYYTSELGATTELHQQMASAQYVPAAVVKPGDRADSGIPGAMYWFSAQ